VYTPRDIIETIVSDDQAVRNRSIEELLSGQSTKQLLVIAREIESFRECADNLYQRVRAALFLFFLYRFYLIGRADVELLGRINYQGVQYSLDRKFEHALKVFLQDLTQNGHNEHVYSALADVYHKLAFEYLIDQVHASIKASRGNGILFSAASLEKYPYGASARVNRREPVSSLYPIIFERTAVRMDLSHSGWSDIFFLGMDFPEGARVINISVNLGISGMDCAIRPPIEAYIRVIDEPVIRITSCDLGETRDILHLEEVFNFASDHLGLLKAGIVASGVIPPALRGSATSLGAILEKLLGRPGGFELVTQVNGIPKGSRLAVSTSLLACVISCCMRFSGQTSTLEGGLTEEERRLVASRAILGEWLGGSGGGWQDSGGIWPGIKVIRGKRADVNAPEWGISRGRLLPEHAQLQREDCVPFIEERLARSIILVHGGMAQDVGPILEMVTEKYLLRLSREWKARKQGYAIFDQIVQSLKEGDIKRLGALTTKNWNNCIKPIIPWVTNSFTEEVCDHLTKFGDDFYGFLMLGGMSGGGMAYLVNPERRQEISEEIAAVMATAKKKYQDALPFAMDPVLYNFEVNYEGIVSEVKAGASAVMPDGYYKLMLMNRIVANRLASSDEPSVFEMDPEVRAFCVAKGIQPEVGTSIASLKEIYSHAFNIEVDHLLSSVKGENPEWEGAAEEIKRENGFDPIAHEEMREEIRSGKISIEGNRLPASTIVEDVQHGDVLRVPGEREDRSRFRALVEKGEAVLKAGEIAVVTLAAGLGSRWTSGAGVVKIVNPFVKINGRHRSFAEIHLAKTRKASRGRPPVQHVFTTSFLTHAAIEQHLQRTANFSYDGPVYLSRAHAIGQKLYPTERDLRFIWEVLPQQVQSENVERVTRDLHEALIAWAKSNGEAEDYNANIPEQRFYPPGHWYELPAMIRNGTLAKMMLDRPSLKYLLLHNGDTLGAWLDPLVIGMHVSSQKCLSFEVTPRRYEDSGGGLARIQSRLRLIEGMALPSEEDEYKLSFYNTLTTLVTIDSLLGYCNVQRSDLLSAVDATNTGAQNVRQKIHTSLRQIERRLPTYATIKEVKFRWGAGQEDIYPVMQCEKLWGDITLLEEIPVQYLAVPRMRGQQLKDPALLDHWAIDGSKEHITSLTDL